MKDLKKKFKESVLSRAARIRPVDIHRASDGMISQVEAGRWLNGQVSKGALFALRLLCEKIEGGYEVPLVDRKERSDKGVPRQGVKVAAPAYDAPKIRADHSDEPTSGAGLSMPVDGKAFSRKDGAPTVPEEKTVLGLHPANGEWQDWMEWCRWSHGGAEFFGTEDGVAGFAQKVGDHTHVRVGGNEYNIAKFTKKQ